MKILIITTNYPPDNDGGVARIVALENFFKEKGCHVEILTRGWELFLRDEIKSVHRVFDPAHANSLMIYKALYKIFRSFFALFNIHIGYYFLWEILCKNKLKKILKNNEYNYVLGSYPSLEVLNVLNSIKGSNAKLIVDYRDPLIFETAELLIKTKFPRTFNRIKIFEKELLIKADLVVTIAPQITEYIKSTYKVKNAITILNGYDEESNSMNHKEIEVFQNELANINSNTINILYTGTLTYYDKERKASYLLDALNEMSDEVSSKFSLSFYGKFNNNDFSNYKKLIKNGVIKLKTNIPRNVSRALQERFDILLLITDKGRTCVTTGKIFEYLKAGKPIIGLTENTNAEYIINITKTGLCVDPHNLEEIKKLLISVSTNGLNPKFDKEAIKIYSRNNQLNNLWENMC